MTKVHAISIVGFSADKTITIAAVGQLTIHDQPVGSLPVPPDIPPPHVDNTLPVPPPVPSHPIAPPPPPSSPDYNPPSGGAVPTPYKK